MKPTYRAYIRFPGGDGQTPVDGEHHSMRAALDALLSRDSEDFVHEKMVQFGAHIEIVLEKEAG